ncbi:MAG: FAD-binding protein [Actinobacteria bacterium]|nr:FAD-binding protein [Actinomycetota bacterium]
MVKNIQINPKELDQRLSRRSFLQGALLTGAAVAGLAVTGCVPQETKPGSDQAGEVKTKPLPLIFKSEEYADGEIVDADLLIIGSGYAGLWALMTAHEKGVANIAVMDKGAIGHSSVASLTLGTSAYVLPEEGDDLDATLEEVVRDADYLSRQDIWYDMFSKSKERLDKINSMGLAYMAPGRLTSDGNVELKISGGTAYTDSTGTDRVCGKAAVCCYMDQVKDYEDVKYFSKTMATELLKEGDRVVGAVGVNRTNGNAVAIRAKATIVATGQCTFKGQHAITEIETGDGYQLVYDAGGRLNNLEFNSFDVDPVGYMLEGGSILCEMGSILENVNGEDFMWSIDPERGCGCNVAYSTRGMAMEVAAGRGPIFCNRKTEVFGEVGQNEHWLPFLSPGSWQRTNEDRFADIGFDLVETPQKFTANSFGIIGAIVTDVNCKTDLPGLFAASVAVSTDPGKIKGVESQRGLWTGIQSGTSSAEYLGSAADVTLADSEIAGILANANVILGRKGTLSANELITKLQRQVFDYRVGLLKTEESLTAALAVCRECQVLLNQVSIDDSHELIKFYEARNMVNIAELHLLASIDRKETRVCHLRMDYPERKDGEWLKWIEWTKGADGKPNKSYRNVPFDEFPVQPDATKGLNAVVRTITA